MGLRTFLSGLALLRYPELIRDLGRRRSHLVQLAEIRSRFPGCRISDDVLLVAYREDGLWLGSGCSLNQGVILSFGDERDGYGKISIDESTWVGQYNNLRAGGGDLRIGRACLISQFCTLVATNHACKRAAPIQSQGPDLTRRGVVLEDDVWLGAGVAVLPGVTIGTGAVIGANAVITRDVAAFEIWGGVPARKIGQRE